MPSINLRVLDVFHGTRRPALRRAQILPAVPDLEPRQVTRALEHLHALGMLVRVVRGLYRLPTGEEVQAGKARTHYASPEPMLRGSRTSLVYAALRRMRRASIPDLVWHTREPEKYVRRAVEYLARRRYILRVARGVYALAPPRR